MSVSNLAVHNQSLTPNKRSPASTLSISGVKIQKSTSWDTPKVHEIIDPISVLFQQDYPPITREVINGQKVSSLSVVDALAKPQLSESQKGKQHIVGVASVPQNTASAIEKVYKKGPWVRLVSKAELYARSGGVLGQCNIKGDSQFSVKGKPDDYTFYTGNKLHEEFHSSIFKKNFDEIIVPWDQKLTKAQKDRQVFQANTLEAAKKNLWSHVGGTVNEIGSKYIEKNGKDGDIFHEKAWGKKTSVSKQIMSDESCKESWVIMENHMYKRKNTQ